MYSDIEMWIRSLPPITRWWFGLSVLIPIIATFGLLNPYYLILTFDEFIYSFQIWRPITAIFYYPTSFSYLVNLYFLYNYSIRLEQGLFSGQTAEYFYMLFFNWICCVILGLLAGMMILMDSLIMTAVYVWCQVNKDVIVYFWFGTHFKAMYLPWVLMIFHFVVDGHFLADLIGILVGHLYFFMKFKYPTDFGGPAMLNTPDFIHNVFKTDRHRASYAGFGQAPTRRTGPQDPPPPQGRHNWGRGQTLGGN